MSGILSAIAPIFLIVGLGYALTRAGVFQREHMSVLAAYVVKAALPALVFVNVHERSLGEILNPTYLLVYALAGMVMVVLARVVALALHAAPAGGVDVPVRQRHQQRVRGRRIRGIVRSVLTHPLIIAIAVALVMTGLGVSLPAMLDDAVQLVAQSSSAVALLSMAACSWACSCAVSSRISRPRWSRSCWSCRRSHSA